MVNACGCRSLSRALLGGSGQAGGSSPDIRQCFAAWDNGARERQGPPSCSPPAPRSAHSLTCVLWVRRHSPCGGELCDRAASTGLEGGAEQARAEETLSQMSLREKIAVLSGSTPFWTGLAEMIGGGYSRHPVAGRRNTRAGCAWGAFRRWSARGGTGGFPDGWRPRLDSGES